MKSMKGNSMKIIARRLIRGNDLKNEIEKLVEEKKIEAGIVLSAVGCVSSGVFRVADGETIKVIDEPLEILSLQGTVGKGGLHLHISYGNLEGIALGGHLVEGNIINTTCELVIGEIHNLSFERALDKNTGYNELVLK